MARKGTQLRRAVRQGNSFRNFGWFPRRARERGTTIHSRGEECYECEVVPGWNGLGIYEGRHGGKGCETPGVVFVRRWRRSVAGDETQIGSRRIRIFAGRQDSAAGGDGSGERGAGKAEEG